MGRDEGLPFTGETEVMESRTRQFVGNGPLTPVPTGWFCCMFVVFGVLILWDEEDPV
jgi:hypothetical protein